MRPGDLPEQVAEPGADALPQGRTLRVAASPVRAGERHGDYLLLGVCIPGVGDDARGWLIGPETGARDQRRVNPPVGG